MHNDLNNKSIVLKEDVYIYSTNLKRVVKISFFIPSSWHEEEALSLLLINDGQDMDAMNFRLILDKLYESSSISPLFFAAIHADDNRLIEYGTQFYLDYKGRGAKAAQYTTFVFDELIPFILSKYNISSFKEKAFAGFSLGGLSALDIVWNRPSEFTKVGVFSGSFWWRSLDQKDRNYNDDKHRIMHQQIRKGKLAPWLNFFFQCGALDELKDRNKNGVIDSIDDTLDIISELKEIGYKRENICYYEVVNGKHDVVTWGSAMPHFLKWGWGIF